MAVIRSKKDTKNKMSKSLKKGDTPQAAASKSYTEKDKLNRGKDLTKTNKFDRPLEKDPLSSGNLPPGSTKKQRGNEPEHDPNRPFSPGVLSARMRGNENLPPEEYKRKINRQELTRYPGEAEPQYQTKIYTGTPYAKSMTGNPTLKPSRTKVNKIK